MVPGGLWAGPAAQGCRSLWLARGREQSREQISNSTDSPGSGNSAESPGLSNSTDDAQARAPFSPSCTGAANEAGKTAQGREPRNSLAQPHRANPEGSGNEWNRTLHHCFLVIGNDCRGRFKRFQERWHCTPLFQQGKCQLTETSRKLFKSPSVHHHLIYTDVWPRMKLAHAPHQIFLTCSTVSSAWDSKTVTYCHVPALIPEQYPASWFYFFLSLHVFLLFETIYIYILCMYIFTTHGTLLMFIRVYTECLSWLPDADKTLRKSNLVRKGRICWPVPVRHPQEPGGRQEPGGGIWSRQKEECCLLTGSVPWSAAFLISPGSHARNGTAHHGLGNSYINCHQENASQTNWTKAIPPLRIPLLGQAVTTLTKPRHDTDGYISNRCGCKQAIKGRMLIYLLMSRMLMVGL